ncbi:hypothetical protein GUA87_09340 [Sneathiella sp. P13V-1]|uniref:hypothetical protein n=1 Tax=Sneathiella sp. P13V-1 TaxID=2697366 RepID=UPI00187B6DC7|nr:hypothetical protein [Sneathiella sp. P13V-1]MBE7637046.1 hypothetical protein [Sneathiella sp. P13V-1]
MPHGLIIFIIQMLALGFCAAFISAIYYLNTTVHCVVGGGHGVCLFDGALSLFLFAATLITAAFAALLFKAYS